VLTEANPAKKTKKTDAALVNGRLAVMSIFGMLFQGGPAVSAWSQALFGLIAAGFERNLAMLDQLSSGPRVRFSADNGMLAVQRRRYELGFQDHACF
jgi:hypothetical protein